MLVCWLASTQQSWCCQSLNEGEDFSFVDMLNREDMNRPVMLNLDSHQMGTMDQHVWDTDANQWLDGLMETADSFMCDGDVIDWLDGLMVGLEEPSSLENTVDVENLVHDMISDDVVREVIDNFDFDFLLL